MLTIEASYRDVCRRTRQYINTLNCQIPAMLQNQGRDQPVAATDVQNGMAVWNQVAEMPGQDGGSSSVHRAEMPGANVIEKSPHFSLLLCR